MGNGGSHERGAGRTSKALVIRMTGWTETYRGTVAPWECDVTEHFTIACYLGRVDQAAASIAEVLGLADLLRDGAFTRRFNLRFVRELRAGDSFHVDSAAVGVDPQLRLGHRVVDSASGERVTWIEETWELPPLRFPAGRREAIGRGLAVWEGPAAEERPEPRSMAGAIASARPGRAHRSRPVRAFLARRLCASIYRCAAAGGGSDRHGPRLYGDASPRVLDL